MKSKKNLVIALMPAVLLPLFPVVTGFYRREISVHMPPCPIRMFFQVYCPGCGATHAVYSLAELDIPGALRNNAIIVAVAVLLILYWLENLLALFGRKKKILPTDDRFYLAAVGVALLYTVVRNFVPALAPL